MKNYLLFRAWARCRQSSLLYFLVLCYVPIISAQNTPISGTVADAQGILPGVTIQVKNKLTNTTTDANGTFQIAAAPEDILVFSYIGYLTQEVPVSNQTTFSIVLKEDTTQLDEVLINAGYYKVKDKERTGSIAKITAKEIETQPVSNFLATMQGRMAGVNITQTTGVPGGGFDIQIRGLNSVRNAGNSPLYIIDGVPYSSEAIGSGQNSPILPTAPSPLNSINPEQIESIEVLKDADATAIYGSRGANGVVLITTKKGKAGKTTFTTTYNRGWGTVTRFMDVLKTPQYLAMRKEAFENDGILEYPETAYDVNGTWDQNRNTNWQKELLGGSAEITNLHTQISGGSDNTQFLISANYNKQTTVFPGSFNYRKMNVLSNINHVSTNKRFKSQFSVGYTFQNNIQPMQDLMSTALALAPNAPALYNDDGSLNWENSTFNNPLGPLKSVYESNVFDLIANGSFSYAILPSLEFKTALGYTALNNDQITIMPSTMYDPAGGFGAEFSGLIAGKVERKSWLIEPQLNWSNQWNKLNITLLAGGTFQHQKGNSIVEFAEGFSNNSLIYNIASASTRTIFSSDANEYKYQAFFGRINLNWDDKYILNFTGRRDGSSRFGPGKQFAQFGAVGGAWIFSREKIFNNSNLLSFGKVRTSYGVTGNDQIGDYQFLDTYASSNVSYNGTIGLQPTRLFNPEFGWETNKKLEVALETGFWKDRIFLTASWYKNKSSNQLVGIPLPGTTGFTTIQANLDAVVENKGTELSIRTVNLKSKDFSWITNFNITFAKNTLVEYPDLENSTYKNTLVIGEPLNIKKVFKYTGVDPETGLYTFEDINGDGKLTTADDKTTIRDFNPQYYGGLQNQFIYKQFQLDLLFQFVKQINYNEAAFFYTPGALRNQPTSIANHWQEPGDSATHQLFTSGVNNAANTAYDNYMNSDAAISDASYIRLKNITLSYDLPENIIKNVKCKISVQAQNLLTFTKYSGADPEFKSTGYLPPLKIISIGTQLTF